MRFLFFVIASQIFFASAIASDCEGLMEDLMIVNFWDCYLSQRFPVYYNNFLQGGYLNMPSARTGCEGEIGAGYAYVPPYNVYSMRAQLTNWLEAAGNYRVFIGVEDPLFKDCGFGDFSDKGANIKVAIIRPEDSDYALPGFAFGLDDFLGTKAFNGEYLVMTKVHFPLNLEWSVGYGFDRYNGWFGGAIWFPFLGCKAPFLRPFSVLAEFDGTDYCKDPHPRGRETKCRFNAGIKYRLFDRVDLSLYYLRGKKLGAAISTFYNFGNTKGFLPKIHDTLPYRAPINTERTGPLRSEDVMAQDFYYAMKEQGFDLLQVATGCDDCGGKILKLVVYNNKYRLEREVKMRLNNLVAYLTPLDVSKVVIVRESEGFPIQEYHYPMPFVRQFSIDWIGNPELDALVPMLNPLCSHPETPRVIFSKPLDLINIEVLPKTRTVFGSTTGKFKYAVGLNYGINGFLWGDIYYSACLGTIFFSDLEGVSSIDRLNPSQLINVQTELIDYYKVNGVTVDALYLQKNWNLGRGWFSRLSLGYFEQMYGGAAAEFLYYPVSDSQFAFGIEGAVVKRRSKTGLGFENTIRKLDGYCPKQVPFTGSQYFLSLYYDLTQLNIEAKVKGGKFLANDWGARFELSRYFASGLRITIWYTWTNGNDRVNGRQYYDKGIELSMPLDIFYTHTERDLWHYGLSAWLRDVGYAAYTGPGLYNMINDQRQWK